MKFQKFFQVTELKDAKVGDLVKLSWGRDNTNIGFVYLIADDYSHLIVLLGSEEAGIAPYSDNFRHDSVCVNYGGDWVIEPLDTTEDGISYLSLDPGTIGFTPAQILLSLGVRKQGGRTETQMLDLQSFKFHADWPNQAYNVSKWKVWASEEHRTETGAVPLLTFEAKPTPSR
jgi:hypothetical protein